MIGGVKTWQQNVLKSSYEDAVDYTLSLMSTGISILFRKPTNKELELFSLALKGLCLGVRLWRLHTGVDVSLPLFVVGRDVTVRLGYGGLGDLSIFGSADEEH